MFRHAGAYSLPESQQAPAGPAQWELSEKKMGAAAISGSSYLTQYPKLRQADSASIRSRTDKPKKTADSAELGAVERRQIAMELSLEKARDLLDWLESNGVDQFDVEIEPSGQFRVVWTQRVTE